MALRSLQKQDCSATTNKLHMLSFQFKVKALKSAQLTSKADMTMCI